MAVVIDGTTGISTPAETVLGNLSYTGTLTGGTGVVNLGSGQVYKDASGKVGLGTTSPSHRLDIQAATATMGVTSTTGTNISYLFSANTGGSVILGKDSSAGGLTGTAYSSYIYSDAAYPLLFIVNSAERARIDSSGNLLVGTTSQTGTGKFTVKATSTNNVADFQNFDNVGRGIVFYNSSGTGVGSISWTASVTTYATSSDYRLKEAIAPMTGALARVALLKPVTYKWKVDGSDGQGFIAHELAEVVAGCVTGEKDATDADGNPQYQGIDTSFLVATLTAAIQEQQTIIVSLQDTLTALTARTSALEERLTALEQA